MINALEQDTFIGQSAVSHSSFDPSAGKIQGRDQVELPNRARCCEGLERHGGDLQVRIRRTQSKSEGAPSTAYRGSIKSTEQ